MKLQVLNSILLLILSLSCSPGEKKNSVLKSPAEFYPDQKAKVLVVGTFHFDFPGLDVVQHNEEDKIDVLKEPKKSEVTELVEYIKKFKPNKIAIEAFESWKATEKLKKYKQGDFRDKRDERYQLGMRLATEFNLDTLYAIDADPMSEDLALLDSAYMEALWKDYDFQSDDSFIKMSYEWFDNETKSLSKVPLLEYFKHTNSRESHLYNYGVYLLGDFKLDNARGADILSVWWYSRNVRIFRKLQEITENQDDRILVLFGNGHAAILRNLIEASPEYEFIEFDSL
jgi:hypothetical protein